MTLNFEPGESRRVVWWAVLLIFLALNGSAPAATRAQPTVTDNVVLVTFDGLRWQEVFGGADRALVDDEAFTEDRDLIETLFWDDSPRERRMRLLPFIWGTIARQGIILGNREAGSRVDVTNGRNFSYPGYNELLTGFADEKIDSNDKRPNPNVTVLEWLNTKKAFASRVAAFASWDVFPFIINEKRSGVPVNAGYDLAEGGPDSPTRLLNALQRQAASPWTWERFDVFTYHLAREYADRARPRVLFISFGDTDEYAHAGDYSAYLKSANRTDALLADLWAYLQSTEGYRGRTTLLITTDHGRSTGKRWVGHGSDWKGSEQIWIAAIGPDTPDSGEMTRRGQYYQNEVAATLAALLGLEYTAEGKAGEPIPEILGR